MQVENADVRLFGTEFGKNRWWRFTQTVKVNISARVPDVESSIGASAPDAVGQVTLVNLHSPSSRKVGIFEGKEFGCDLKVGTKVEVLRRALAQCERRAIVAGDINFKDMKGLESLLENDARGQWGVKPNHTRMDRPVTGKRVVETWGVLCVVAKHPQLPPKIRTSRDRHKPPNWTKNAN